MAQFEKKQDFRYLDKIIFVISLFIYIIVMYTSQIFNNGKKLYYENYHIYY